MFWLHSFKTKALQFVKQRLPDFLRLYIDADQQSRPEANLVDLSVEILHLLLTHLLHNSKDQLGIASSQTAAFLKALKKGNLYLPQSFTFPFLKGCEMPILFVVKYVCPVKNLSDGRDVPPTVGHYTAPGLEKSFSVGKQVLSRARKARSPLPP